MRNYCYCFDEMKEDLHLLFGIRLGPVSNDTQHLNNCIMVAVVVG